MVKRPAHAATPTTAPVEQTGGDPAMTGGQVVHGPGARRDDLAPPGAPPPEAAVSGGAQSMPGARVSDRSAGSDARPSASEFEDADGGGLDALALAGAVLRGRLQDPRAVLAVLGAVVVLVLALRRRSRRRAAGCYRVEDIERLAVVLDRR